MEDKLLTNSDESYLQIRNRNDELLKILEESIHQSKSKNYDYISWLIIIASCSTFALIIYKLIKGEVNHSADNLTSSSIGIIIGFFFGLTIIIISPIIKSKIIDRTSENFVRVNKFQPINSLNFVGADNNLALANLRIQFENEFRHLAAKHLENLENTDSLRLEEIADELFKIIPPKSLFRNVKNGEIEFINVLNETNHALQGDKVNTDLALHIIKKGNLLLKEMQNGFKEYDN